MKPLEKTVISSASLSVAVFEMDVRPVNGAGLRESDKRNKRRAPHHWGALFLRHEISIFISCELVFKYIPGLLIEGWCTGKGHFFFFGGVDEA